MELISGYTLAHTVWIECLESRCAVCVKSLMESSATCLASISSLLGEAQDEALYILVILPLLLITLHNTFQRPPSVICSAKWAMPRSLCHPPNSRDMLHFNSAVTVMRQETALPHLHHETVKQGTHGLCHTALFKLRIHLQHQQMAEKSAADLMCCLVFIMWGETKRGMINVWAGE